MDNLKYLIDFTERQVFESGIEFSKKLYSQENIPQIVSIYEQSREKFSGINLESSGNVINASRLNSFNFFYDHAKEAFDECKSLIDKLKAKSLEGLEKISLSVSLARAVEYTKVLAGD